ncbi:GntR family transcriptional regulator [Priestia endophytica]|uniref:Transcriptional regulator, GntR family n=1 Tax=Priestia endophytica DSM 13796 TaxID=1121089 RepID=A0A1I6BZF0_9BACI|nr:GntR family transcriptional regulator [Priestia endophytica]KYG27769.1 GntR family transcriptional regulator [Priestia endophytica]MBG9813203.1 GntR family transcriptional regulator [Priestia endophytica]SFQ86306.1 transcriptional regulator, GntR family [Priestia endophytica DSM 13796]
MSKYEQISNEMRKRVQEGEYPSDQPIPDEKSLSKEFDCSRMTMKKALDILVAEGLLYRKRGHGTFIVKSAIQHNLVNVTDRENLGLTGLLQDKDIESEIIRFNVLFPTEKVAEHLSIDHNTPVYHIIRLRNVENEPFVIEETFMPTNIIGGINEEVLHSSIYNHITHTLGLTIGGSHRKIRADKPNELDQTYLGCATDDPVLEVEQVAYLNTGIPFEYSFSRHRYDKFVFTTVNIRR